MRLSLGWVGDLQCSRQSGSVDLILQAWLLNVIPTVEEFVITLDPWVGVRLSEGQSQRANLLDRPVPVSPFASGFSTSCFMP